MINVLNISNFNEIEDKELAVIDFSATWCGPCRMMEPVIKEISDDLQGKAEFYSVDVDDNMDIANKYEITGVPSLVILKKGEYLDMKVGLLSKDEVLEWIGKYM